MSIASNESSRKCLAKKKADFADLRRENLNFSVPVVASGALCDTLRTAAKIGAFRQSTDEIVAWCKRQDDAILSEILLCGLDEVCAKAYRKLVYQLSTASLIRHKAKARATIRTKFAKAQAFDRIVSMLDTVEIGGKPIGDFNRMGLLRLKDEELRMAKEDRRTAGEAILRAEGREVRAALWGELAALLPNDKTTLREATGRDKIVALLTTTFKEVA